MHICLIKVFQKKQTRKSPDSYLYVIALFQYEDFYYQKISIKLINISLFSLFLNLFCLEHRGRNYVPKEPRRTFIFLQ